jgi:DNA/RNA endonuclease YhcR with UshA esterase domain
MRTTFQLSVLAALLILVVSAIAADLPATMPTTAPAAITWDQAKDYIGQDVTVTGPVVGTHDFGDAAVLNIGKDYPDAGRCTVYISAEARAGMPADLDMGKTIAVTGTLKLYRNVPEIRADAAHIAVVPQPAGAATQP